MRILMIAPQPYFEPRGAPLCVDQHIRALLSLGYVVDLVTYPIGQSVCLPGLTIYRAWIFPWCAKIKPGFSLFKIPLDLLVFMTALWRLCVGRYSHLYTHEEASVMGMVLAPLFRCCHLYYMHCDLSELMPLPMILRPLVKCVQALAVRRANAVVTFYPDLSMLAQKLAPRQRVFTLLPAAVDEALPSSSEEEVALLRREWMLGDGAVLLYTGTLEAYQGIEMLLRSILLVHIPFPSVRYVIVGGLPHQIAALRHLARRLGVIEYVRFVGQRPLEEMPRFLALADIVVSPRCRGTHVPLKLYTYLYSGKALLATDIRSHSQILTSDLALLVPPTPRGLASGTLELLRAPSLARSLGERGQSFAREHASWLAFLAKSRQIYAEVAPLTL